ncbi:hypothetical protein QBC38DRAFT_488364 [Podospora fimiseda]|uniref:Uncharacterized protein n=1 Tax=Podospora fimiseda TaxID=252190 RepID=A0AAN7BGZ4_9PEZI|nr:hypothetical protein QBC38DRAFT_488364 [Podospora fimiseda]
MCTYDYTPYVGCKGGQQHYYLQWMKCSKAIENGDQFCPLDQSVETDSLRQLSRNVLSCPLHTPIVVQQYEFEFIQATTVPESVPTPRSVKARRGNMTPKSRTPKSGTFRQTFEEQAPRRKRASARDLSPAHSDSDSEDARPKTSDGVKRSERGERGRSSGPREKSHRRVSSADMDMLPTRSSTLRKSQRKAERPPRPEPEGSEHAEQPREEVEEKPKTKSPRTKHNLDISTTVGIGITGLPTSPDIYRRPSEVHRAKSQEKLKQDGEKKQDAERKPDPTTVSPVTVSPSTFLASNTGSDSSPVNSSEPLPFSQQSLAARRGRRSTRSVRKSTEESPMTRIDELVGQEPVDDVPSSSSRPVSRSSTSRVPSRHATPRLSQDAFIPPVPPLSPGLHSPRGFGTFPEPPLSPRSFRTNFSYEVGGDASSIKSGRSRKGYEEQVADAKKWVAARESMPINHGGSGNITDLVMQSPRKMSEPNLVNGRDSSMDSGYTSGQTQQRRGSEATVVVPQTEGGARLQKTMSPSGLSQSHRPPPLQLVGAHAGRLPPCALPVSLYSPAVPGQQNGDPASLAAAVNGKDGKVPLLQRMGLRKKISGLVGKGEGKDGVKV